METKEKAFVLLIQSSNRFWCCQTKLAWWNIHIRFNLLIFFISHLNIFKCFTSTQSVTCWLLLQSFAVAVLTILLQWAPMFSIAHAQFLCRYNVAIKCATITPGTFGLLFCWHVVTMVLRLPGLLTLHQIHDRRSKGKRVWLEGHVEEPEWHN